MEDERFDIVWDFIKPTPKQLEFMEVGLNKKYVLYGGARGGAKSYILRWGLLWRLVKWYSETGVKNIRVGLFCEDYPALKGRQIGKIRSEFPDWLGELKTTHTEGLGFFLHPEYGGGAILLHNLDDPEKYKGHEFAGAAIDEVTRNPSIEVFDILRGSIRWPGISDPFFWGATNPDGPGLIWVRELWIEGKFPEHMEPLRDKFAFVQALPSDNPHLDEDYWVDLRTQPKHIQKAWVEGDWYSVGGAVFEEWRNDLHVVDNYRIPNGWRYAAGLDFGYRANGWLGLFAMSPEGEIVCFKEKPFKGLFAYEAGMICAEWMAEYPIEYIAADGAMWQQGGIGPTQAEEFSRGLRSVSGDSAPTMIETTHGPGSRLARLQLLHRYLHYKEQEDGTVREWDAPLLRFQRQCEYVIKTIPALPYDKTNTEDVDTSAEDHAYDAVCYFLMSRPPMGRDVRGKKHRTQDDHPGLKANKPQYIESMRYIPPTRDNYIPRGKMEKASW